MSIPRSQPSTQHCPSCSVENSILSLRCTACGSYIRDRVPTLDLFSTLWGMIEAPGETYLRIARSEQKNYSFLLFAITGPLILATILVASHVGDTAIPFSYLLLAFSTVGPVLGMLLFTVSALLLRLVLRVTVSVDLKFRQLAAYIAYGISPLAWASFILLPIQLGLFGTLLFSTNPPAWGMQPLPYWLLASLDIIALIWSMTLLPRAFAVHDISYRRAFTLLLGFWGSITVIAAAAAVVIVTTM